ncbi:C1 family peptidase [Mycoplasmopsis iners]|uniref:C1 family peptidase n=1 Tax=Mycoplasmopsis iners TaxID=76630 RepID=UPI000496B4B2|nr:C1 family peptidase [Mycoplasmopsis iners]
MKIEQAKINEYYLKYSRNPINKVIENAITKNGVFNATYNNDMQRIHNFEFSNQVKKAGITNQKNSGRCWIFSALNILKTNVVEALNLKEFEFSQNYLLFWDKLEKANNILELMIEMPNLDFDDRLFAMFMEHLTSDGGYWEWAQSLIKKYGAVPKSVMEEVANSGNTDELNVVLQTHLISTIKTIKQAFSAQKTLDEIREIKEKAIERIFEINAKVLGLPPQTFSLEYRDKDDKFHKLNNLTPLEFVEKYAKLDYLNFVNLLDDPRKKYPKNTLLVSKYFASVIEGKKLSSINVDMQILKEATIKSLLDNNPVWFDCDVSASSDRKSGIMDTKIYSIDETLRPFNTLTKQDRVNYRISAPTHAMTFVGVDLDETGKSIKWEVENSWGDKVGNKGYFSMSDKWFDEYVFGVIVDPKYVNETVLKEVEQNQPITIEPWDVLS